MLEIFLRKFISVLLFSKKYFLIASLLFFSVPLFAQRNKIDSLEKKIRTLKEDTSRVNAVNKLAYLFTDSDLTKALQYGNDAMRLAEKLNYKNGVADAYNIFGIVYYRQSNYDKALENHLKSLKIKEQTNDEEGLSVSLNNIGNVYYDKGDYDKSLEYLMRSVKIDEKTKNKKAMANSYSNVGRTYEEQGSFDKAVEYYLKSLKIDEELGNKKGIGDTYNLLGVINYDQGKNDLALEYYLKSLKIKEEFKDNKIGIAYTLNNIGNIYNKKEDFKKALENYQKALVLLEEMGDKRAAALVIGSIGTIDHFQHNYSKAIEQYQKALSMHQSLGDQSGIIISEVNMGASFLELKSYQKAVLHINNGLKLAKKINAKDLMKEAYDGLAETYLKMNDYKKAYEYRQLFFNTRDSLLNKETTKQIAELQTKYETDKKEKQIALLNSETQIKNLKIKTQSRKIFLIASVAASSLLGTFIILLLYQRRKTKYNLKVQQMDNKFLRFQLKPHFVKNALMAIRKYIPQHPEVAEEYFDKYSNLMREVLINSEKEKISLEAEFSMLKKYMDLESLRVKHGFDYEVNIDSSIDEEAVKVPPLILQPIVENAIWHGIADRTEKGKISIRVSLENKILQCVVENHCGGTLSVEVEQPEKGKSFGLQITRERLKLLAKETSGKWNLETTPEADGMKVQLGIPV